MPITSWLSGEQLYGGAHTSPALIISVIFLLHVMMSAAMPACRWIAGGGNHMISLPVSFGLIMFRRLTIQLVGAQQAAVAAAGSPGREHGGGIPPS